MNYSTLLFDSGILAMRETSASFLPHPVHLQRSLLAAPVEGHALSQALADVQNASAANGSVFVTQIVLSPGDNPGSNLFFFYIFVAYSLLLLSLGMCMGCTCRVCRFLYRRRIRSETVKTAVEEIVDSPLICDSVAARCLHCGHGNCSVCGQQLGVVLTNNRRRPRRGSDCSVNANLVFASSEKGKGNATEFSAAGADCDKV
jgi:hypothetical protein